MKSKLLHNHVRKGDIITLTQVTCKQRIHTVVFIEKSLSHWKCFFFISIFLFRVYLAWTGNLQLDLVEPWPFNHQLHLLHAEHFGPLESHPGITCRAVQAAASQGGSPGSCLQAGHSQASSPLIGLFVLLGFFPHQRLF